MIIFNNNDNNHDRGKNIIRAVAEIMCAVCLVHTKKKMINKIATPAACDLEYYLQARIKNIKWNLLILNFN